VTLGFSTRKYLRNFFPLPIRCGEGELEEIESKKMELLKKMSRTYVKRILIYKY
jgi:hypothetical protein